jgi:hypothetical protein
MKPPSTPPRATSKPPDDRGLPIKEAHCGAPLFLSAKSQEYKIQQLSFLFLRAQKAYALAIRRSRNVSITAAFRNVQRAVWLQYQIDNWHNVYQFELPHTHCCG